MSPNLHVTPSHRLSLGLPGQTADSTLYNQNTIGFNLSHQCLDAEFELASQTRSRIVTGHHMHAQTQTHIAFQTLFQYHNCMSCVCMCVCVITIRFHVILLLGLLSNLIMCACFHPPNRCCLFQGCTNSFCIGSFRAMPNAVICIR